MDSLDTTDFGFATVSKYVKSIMVSNVFYSVVHKYDVMNDLMSFGIHRLWKDLLVQHSGVSQGDKVLDLAGGTGDLTVRFVNLVGSSGLVVLSDINDSMLYEGRKKIRNLGILSNVFYVRSDAEYLPFCNEMFDCVAVSFGIRNMINKDKALRSMYRILKYGGRLLILEFSKPLCIWLSMLYDIYSFYVLPNLGSIIVNDRDSYRYLVESIRMHPDQETFKLMMLDAGFSVVEYFNINGGIVALHCGYKL